MKILNKKTQLLAAVAGVGIALSSSSVLAGTPSQSLVSSLLGIPSNVKLNNFSVSEVSGQCRGLSSKNKAKKSMKAVADLDKAVSDAKNEGTGLACSSMVIKYNFDVDLSHLPGGLFSSIGLFQSTASSHSNPNGGGTVKIHASGTITSDTLAAHNITVDGTPFHMDSVKNQKLVGKLNISYDRNDAHGVKITATYNGALPSSLFSN